MSGLDNKLTTIENSIQELIRKGDSLRLDNQELKSKIEALVELVDVQKNQIKDLEENNKIVKIAGTISDSEADRAELKKQIEAYMSQIDQCIALLSS